MAIVTHEYTTATSTATDWTNPSNAADGSTSTYATREIAKNTSFETGKYVTGTVNDSSSVSNSTITKVEIGVAAKASASGNCNLRCIPYFGGSSAGNNHDTAELGTSNSTTYFDVTTDTNAPSTWTWTNVADLDVRMFGDNDNFTSAQTISIALIYVRVTYDINTFIQEGYRWRNDNGSETTATWKAAQDTDINVDTTSSQRLRIIVDPESGVDNPTTQFRLEYKETVSGTYAAVPIDTTDAGNDLYIKPSSNITASGENTTAQLTAPSGKTTSNFITGRMQDDENPCDTINLDSTSYTEVEFSVGVGDTGIGNTYDLRLTATTDGTNYSEFSTYSVTPQLIIGPGAALDTELHYYKSISYSANSDLSADDFSDSTTSAGIWTDNDSTNGTTTITGGQMVSYSGNTLTSGGEWYQDTTGDFDCSIKVVSITNTDAITYFGVYDGYDGFVYAIDGGSLLYYTLTGNGSIAVPSFPFYLRVSIIDSKASLYHSTDGTNWTADVDNSSIGTMTNFNIFTGTYPEIGSALDVSPYYTTTVDVGDGTGTAWANVSNSQDGSISTFATGYCDWLDSGEYYTNTFNATVNNNTETSGTITAVYARVYLKVNSGNNDPQYALQVSYNSGTNWTSGIYKDITSTTGQWLSWNVTSLSGGGGAPSQWTWSDVDDLLLGTWGYEVGQSSTEISVAKMELQVYTESVDGTTTSTFDLFTNDGYEIGSTTDISLYDNDTAMSNSLPVYVNGAKAYAHARLTSYSGSYTSDLRIRKGGTTYQVATQWEAET